MEQTASVIDTRSRPSEADQPIVWIESGVSGEWTILHTYNAVPEWAMWFELGPRAYGYYAGGDSDA